MSDVYNKSIENQLRELNKNLKEISKHLKRIADKGDRETAEKEKAEKEEQERKEALQARLDYINESNKKMDELMKKDPLMAGGLDEVFGRFYKGRGF